MATVTNKYQQYKRHDVLMASPIELIVMLYTGCIKQMKLARIAITKEDIEQCNTSLQKAQDIIMGLINSLDFNFDISKDLLNLYDFVGRELIDVNITKEEKRIEPLIEIMSELRSSWIQVQKETKMTHYPEVQTT